MHTNLKILFSVKFYYSLISEYHLNDFPKYFRIKIKCFFDNFTKVNRCLALEITRSNSLIYKMEKKETEIWGTNRRIWKMQSNNKQLVSYLIRTLLLFCNKVWKGFDKLNLKILSIIFFKHFINVRTIFQKFNNIVFPCQNGSHPFSNL